MTTEKAPISWHAVGYVAVTLSLLLALFNLMRPAVGEPRVSYNDTIITTEELGPTQELIRFPGGRAEFVEWCQGHPEFTVVAVWARDDALVAVVSKVKK